jgi:hypothetical protein
MTTTQVFNPQWGRMMDIDRVLAERMGDHNFHPEHTGGGCFAWKREIDGGGHVLITLDDGMSLGDWPSRDKAEWLAGRYDAEGNFVLVADVTLEQAVLATTRLPAPSADDPERSMQLSDRLS